MKEFTTNNTSYAYKVMVPLVSLDYLKGTKISDVQAFMKTHQI